MMFTSFLAVILGVFCEYESLTYLGPDDLICTASEILGDGKMDCKMVRGDIRIEGKSFDEEIQKRFHSVRVLRGRVVLDNASLTDLHAFKNLWDIVIEDPLDKDYNWKVKNYAFVVTNNPKLKKIRLDNLISFISTYGLGFFIRNNGEYKMNRSQLNRMRYTTGNRNLYTEIDEKIDLEEETEYKKYIKYVVVAFFSAPGLAVTIGSAYLIHYCIVSNKSTNMIESYKRFLNEAEEDGIRRIKKFPKKRRPNFQDSIFD